MTREPVQLRAVVIRRYGFRDAAVESTIRAFWAKFERAHVHSFGATSIPGTFACDTPGCARTVRRLPG